MNWISRYWDKLFLKQWSIGFLRGNIFEIIKEQKSELSFQWMKIGDKERFYADPFIFKNGNDQVNILFEDLHTDDRYGKISLIVMNSELKPVLQKSVLDNKIHLSYPFVFNENGSTYVFPEAARSGGLYCYEFDFKNNTLINKSIIMDVPVIDPTILKYNNKYWLFCTQLDKYYNSKLYIYYSETLFGPYKAHLMNPVKNNIDGSRPAGNFIFDGANIYRPSQNCKEYYGKSITINKIDVLNEKEFIEHEYLTIDPDKKSNYDFGLHTINYVDDIIVVDGLRRYFQPIKQLKRHFRKITARPNPSLNEQ